MKRICLFLSLALSAFSSVAQDELFGTEKSTSRKGFIINVNAGVDFPAADMADRFGTSYRLGGAVLYKTRSNWMFGPKIDFILGNQITDDSLLINLTQADGSILNQDGQLVGVGTFERGYLIGIQGSKIMNLSKTNADNGLLITTTVGFMQHKINLFDKQKTIPQLRGDYRKGYDRLTNGMFVEQYLGYNYFSKDGFINFHIGLNVTAGFTQGRRDYLYDVMRPDNASRLDILFGIRGGWYFPIFKRKSEEIFFE
ncbi:MAG: hypothetical protein K0R82_1903 [Flavipsychrobacter sp.]|jgi:hypothetical protein|nr:hypothetical protein [Flavipsychrobacter sp.]